MRRRTTITAIAAALGTILGLAAPASATLEVRDKYAFQFTSSFDDCGFEVVVDHDIHGVFSARQIKSSGGTAWLAHDNYWARDTSTNPENGRSFTLTFNGNYRELRGQRIQGDVWRFVWKDSGATWTLRDGDGNVVWRDRGTVTGVDVFDTRGDDQLGGDVIYSEVTSLKGKYQEL